MIGKIFKALVIGGVWSVLYLFVTRYLFIFLYNFDYQSIEVWKQVSIRWNSGVAIKNTRDYLILFSLLMLIPVWVYGWKYCYRLNYVDLLLWPFRIINKWLLSRYEVSNKRILLKNIGAGVRVEEEIKFKTAAVKPMERNDADKIRGEVSKKLRDEQKVGDN